MKNVIWIFMMVILPACSEDPADSAECAKASQELEDATEALRILEIHAPPSVCNPCTAQQVYQKERAKLVQVEAQKKSAKNKACN